ncbi:hypothetical protein MIB92_07655 [Aestuariirhabdus sp. Z084]|uniref:MaoC family dehydratase n=1 Tax=Aestuariirhabdus haliotis TaxID=2918751 RepID=UPI00201B42BF|nr:MaoC/PaaZ C-terminal domain-containing protein [Aestuariirhabdus haliotis]MCL6415520.1 hypothetical protein [Aestuariirhabdus haliotis]MCL6419275.1 hypothetical protein [Aestuariirhabdus haliotis]
MSDVTLSFDTKPAIAPAMLKALLLPRKGFNAATGLPSISAAWNDLHIDPNALDNYLNLLGLAATDHLPVLYPHVIAGAMHMHMLTHKAFPIRLLGAVHLKNRILQHRPIGKHEVLSLSSEMGDTRLVEKGVEFDFTTQVRVQGETVWEETTIYFMAGRFGGKENPSPQQSFDLASLDSAEEIASWSIPANRGKQYARITGDYNPIHMSATLAKLFGFKRDIAHGFGVLAQAIERSQIAIESGKKTQVDVIFKGPVYLDSSVQIQQNQAQDAARFDLYCGDNPKPSICAAVLSV